MKPTDFTIEDWVKQAKSVYRREERETDLDFTHEVLTDTRPSHVICTTSSLLSLFAALALHLWSLSLIHVRHHPRYEQLIVRFYMIHLVSGTSSLFHSVNLVPVSLALFQAL